MKPDAYFPFYAKDFWMAVEGQPDDVVVAYMRVITFYWCHKHCSGIEDHDESMRKLCRVDKSDWERIRGVVFDNDHFMTMGEDGKWHQKRAAVLWSEVNRKYSNAVERSKAAHEARWGTKKKGRK